GHVAPVAVGVLDVGAVATDPEYDGRLGRGTPRTGAGIGTVGRRGLGTAGTGVGVGPAGRRTARGCAALGVTTAGAGRADRERGELAGVDVAEVGDEVLQPVL